jgi:regulator of replication initiation timing
MEDLADENGALRLEVSQLAKRLSSYECRMGDLAKENGVLRLQVLQLAKQLTEEIHSREAVRAHVVDWLGRVANTVMALEAAHQSAKAVPQLVCTFASTGRLYSKQPIYHCFTCQLDEQHQGKRCCAACAMICHAGHNVAYVDSCTSPGQGFYCDCGAGAGPRPCLCMLT